MKLYTAWTSAVPKSWKRLRLKDIGFLYGGLTGKSGDDFRSESEEGTKPFIPFTNILNNQYIDFSNYKSVVMSDDEQQNRVIENDLLFLMSSEDYESIAKASVVIGDPGEVYLNSFCKGLRITNNEIYAPFVCYQLSSSIARDSLRIEATGFTRINIQTGKVSSADIAVPSIDEQKKIVVYLDEKIASIDSYISARAEELELLKAFRKSKIAETITHGLKTGVPTKASPIGDIPAHWGIRRTKDVCSAIFTGATPSTSIEEYWDGDIPWLPSGCCHDCYVTEAPKYITQAGLENSSTRWIPKGTTIMAITGATCAQLGSLKIDACANQSVVAFIEEKEKLDARFLFYELLALRDVILTNRTGGAQAGIDTGDCMNIIISLPPLSEQKEIANYLDEECEKIDRKCALIDEQIKKLQLLKRALVNEVVTGKRRIL